MMEIFHHSILILKEKRLLEMDENKKTGLEVREQSSIEPLLDYLDFIKSIKTA
jgi:hypothetical protein